MFSAGLLGIDAYLVDVEVDIQTQSLPSWSTVGLAESSVKESKERVISAIKNSGYDFMYRRVVINLAPADKRKDGTSYDLPIALGLITASGLIQNTIIAKTVFVGELGLTGELKPVKGILPIVILAKKLKMQNVILPYENAKEAAIVDGINVYGMKTLSDVVRFLRKEVEFLPEEVPQFIKSSAGHRKEQDWSEIRGQYQAKRALEIAAAGGHNVLLNGSPGAGKTMLASRISTILPPLSFDESLETSKIYSVMGLLKHGGQLLSNRPFRHPHHSVSNSGLIGGGTFPKPGEVSLAHNGVLFLDEIPEFPRHVLELLRQPLEDHEVTISRASLTLTYPARFVLVASCNPCPCGYYGHPKVNCNCHPHQIERYKAKLSGPLLDRIDIQIDVPPVSYRELRKEKEKSETSQDVMDRVVYVRQVQEKRFKKHQIYLNSQMSPKHIETYCQLDEETENIIKTAMEKFQLSARGINRILKVSRTIADLSGTERVLMKHVLEAIQYRNLACTR